MRSNLIAMMALTTTALIPLSAVAQQDRDSANQQQRQTSQGATQSKSQQQSALAAQQFVRQAAISNMFEIEASRLAEDRAGNERVRGFAQQMIQDHTGIGDELQAAVQATKNLSLTVPKQLDAAHQRQLQELRGLKDRRFDRTYVRMQVEAHEQAVNLFERFTGGANATELQQFAKSNLPTLREHEQTIRQIRDEVFPSAGTASAPDGSDRARSASQDAQQGQQAGRQQQRGQDPAQIIVQQQPPSVNIDQASPRVTVHQAQPNVTVRQGRPEIMVRQPRPTITVDIPQPQITVRMPEPDVNVSQAQPQVSVQQAQPQVRVQRPDQQAQVEVERAQPKINVQRQEQQANVTVQPAEREPVVRYEREEPRVVINRAQGQPTVRYERMGEAGQQSAGQDRAAARQQSTAQQQAATQQQAAAGQQAAGGATEQERNRARQRVGATAQTEGAASDETEVRHRAVRVSALMDLDVYNARGERLGDTDAVVQARNGTRFVVIANGGFLGLGEDKVAFPVERFWMRGDRLVIRGVNEDDIDNMTDYRDDERNYTELNDSATIRLREWM